MNVPVPVATPLVTVNGPPTLPSVDEQLTPRPSTLLPATVTVTGIMNTAYGLPAAVGEVIVRTGATKSASTVRVAVHVFPTESVATTVTVYEASPVVGTSKSKSSVSLTGMVIGPLVCEVAPP